MVIGTERETPEEGNNEKPLIFGQNGLFVQVVYFNPVLTIFNEVILNIPDSVTIVSHGGRDIYLLGTAHVSAKSVDDVTDAVNAILPDTICVELCEPRLKSIRDRNAWQKMDIFKVLMDKKVPLLFSQLMMTSFYRKLGKELEVTPGAEMIRGVDEAEQRNIQLVLADRNIETTLRRVWGLLTFWQKMNFLSAVILSMFSKSEDIDTEMVEKLKSKDHLETAMEEFADQFPGIRRPLIEERDIFLAEKIKAAPGQKVLAVVGAAHVPGIIKRFDETHDINEINVIPKTSLFAQILPWMIPVVVIAMISFGFSHGIENGKEMVKIWILTVGSCAALGAIIAGGHPLAVIASFCIAPFTIFFPIVKTNFVAGIIQAVIKKPTVADLEAVPDSMESFAKFRKNAFTRVILVFLAVTIGSVGGKVVAAGVIAKMSVSTPKQEVVIPNQDLLKNQDLKSK